VVRGWFGGFAGFATGCPGGAVRTGLAMERKELLTIEEVAELTGFSVGTLYHWVSEGRIPVLRFSARCIRFRQSDIDAWFEQLLVPSTRNAAR